MNTWWDDAAAIGWIAVGGGVGAAARYAVDQAVSSRWRTSFPMGIFLVNVSGALLLGLFVGLISSGVSGPDLSIETTLITTGLLGGYTTFSTASVDAVRLARDGRRVMALIYAVGTMLAAVAAALAGLALGALWAGGS